MSFSEKSGWVLSGVLVVFGIILIVSIYNLKRDWRLMVEQNRRIVLEFKRKEELLLEAERVEARLTGRKIDFRGLHLLNGGQREFEESGVKGYRLVVVIDQLGCGICQEELINFGRDLVRLGCGERVCFVLGVSERRLGKKFVFRNRPEYLVYEEYGGNFIKANGIELMPIVMIIDGQQEVVRARVILSFARERNELFFLEVSRLLGAKSFLDR